jgi:protein required for attachment to host cells
MNSTVWIVIASQTIARVFRYKGDGKSPALEFTLDHPAGRARTHELVSDRPGRTFAPNSSLRHAFAPASTAHEHAAETFAHLIGNRLSDERRRGGFSGLALVCEPKFLGRLKASLDRETKKCLIATRAAGLTTETGRTLARSLKGLIEPAQTVRLG